MNVRRASRCLFLIDEFGSIGRLDDIPRDIATMSGSGVDMALIIQDLNQLKRQYGDADGTILSNCRWKWFCAVDDLKTAKWLSETLGKETITTRTTNYSTSEGSNSSSEGESVHWGETGRSLLNPDEIMTMGNDVAIALPPSGRPKYLRPVDYWDLLDAFWRLEEKAPELYWEPPVTFDSNPSARSGSGAGGEVGGGDGTCSKGN